MKKILALGALTTGVLGMTNGCADQTNVFDDSGNAYCEPAVKTILYKGIGGSGQYETVTNIAGQNDCAWATKSYGGPLAPYDEEVRANSSSLDRTSPLLTARRLVSSSVVR